MKSKAFGISLLLFAGLMVAFIYRAGIPLAVTFTTPLYLAAALFCLRPQRYTRTLAQLVTLSNGVLALSMFALAVGVFFVSSSRSVGTNVAICIFVLAFFFMPAAVSAILAWRINHARMHG